MHLDRLKTLWPEIEPLFDELLELPGDERAARLEALGRQAPEKRELLEALLHAERDSGELLSRPARLAPEEVSATESDAIPPGTRLGPWAIRRELGRGGMGAVMLAERADGQFEQQVAIKFVRSDARHVATRERFRTERDILARLQHPNIARLVDGGVRDDGSPYLVMEYVDGRSITAWCDERRLDVRARLRLFRQVCDAVEYAHGMLVVHRDLKPDNIFVTARGEVKLLDFGVAKLTDADTPAEATGTLARILTPAYAAPEQFLGEPVTALTDEYQLALVLYELLTGRRPHGDPGSSALQHQRAVLDGDPRPPSRAATQAAVAGAAFDREQIAAQRGATVAGLARALAGDLDAIVLRALEREPERRYSSVEAFRRDLDLLLEDRPVSARRASARERTAKLFRRHRAAVIAGALAIASLVVGLAGVILQARIATRERDLARAAERKATAINDFVLRELLQSATPERNLGRPLTVAEVLAGASRTVGFAFPGDPLTEAGVRQTLARSYQSLGQLDSAAVHARAAERALAARLPATAPERLESRALLAELALARGEYSRAREGFEDLVRDQSRMLGPTATATLRSRGGVGRALANEARLAAADSVLSAAVTALKADADWRLSSELRAALADVWARRARASGADSLLRQVLDTQRRHVGPDHPLVLATMLRRARALLTDLRPAEAARVLEDAVRTSERVNGPGHPVTAEAWSVLAAAYAAEGRHHDCADATRRALEIFRGALGSEHPGTLRTMRNLAISLRQARRYASADSAYREAWQTCERTLGPGHPQTLEALRGLVYLRLDEGRVAEARTLALRIRSEYERRASAADVDPGDLIDFASYLVEASPEDVRDPRRAVGVAQRAVERTRQRDYLALRALGFAAAAAADTDAAIGALRSALELPEGVRSWTTEMRLVELLDARREYASCEQFLSARLRRLRELRGEDDPYAAKTMRYLAHVCLATGRGDEAERWLIAALAQLRRTRPETHWEVGRTKSELGERLSTRGLTAESESLLVQGFRALDADLEVDSAQVEQSRARITAAYASAGRAREALAWRRRAVRARTGPAN